MIETSPTSFTGMFMYYSHVEPHMKLIMVASRYMTLLLREGRFVPHPFEVQPNGLLAVEKGIQALHDKTVSSKKLVYRISDTPNLEQYQ